MALSRFATKNRFVHIFYNAKKTLATQTSVQEADTEAEYPPVKPKLPPGTWGNLSRKTTWKRYEEQEQLRSIPTVQGRLENFKNKGEYGRKVWLFKPCKNLIPRTYEYQQEKTKSRVLEGSLPEIYNDMDIENELSLLKPIVMEILLSENDIINRDRMKNVDHCMIQSMLYSIITVLSNKNNHLLHGCLSENIEIQAFWDRYGTDRPFPKKRVYQRHYHDNRFRPDDRDNQYQPTEKECNFTPMQGFEESAEYVGDFVADYQLRSEKMLPEFIPRSDPLCKECNYVKSHSCSPSVHGQQHDWRKLETKVGYKVGDPWEFGTVSIINPFKHKMFKYEKEVGEKHAQEFRMGCGLGAAFIWAAAQAYSQGFNSYDDIAYPFTTQIIITNGKTFSFHAYQLNTLELWKCDESNPLQNICWQIPEENLYDVVENGEVKGFNDDVFKNLLKFLLLKPVDRGYNLKPTIPPDSPDHREKETTYILKEEIQIVEEKKLEYDES